VTSRAFQIWSHKMSELTKARSKILVLVLKAFRNNKISRTKIYWKSNQKVRKFSLKNREAKTVNRTKWKVAACHKIVKNKKMRARAANT